MTTDAQKVADLTRQLDAIREAAAVFFAALDVFMEAEAAEERQRGERQTVSDDERGDLIEAAMVAARAADEAKAALLRAMGGTE